MNFKKNIQYAFLQFSTSFLNWNSLELILLGVNGRNKMREDIFNRFIKRKDHAGRIIQDVIDDELMKKLNMKIEKTYNFPFFYYGYEKE